MTNYIEHFISLLNPRNTWAPKDRTPDSAGGPALPLDKWARLDRWLILGAAGSRSHATEHELTRDNARTIAECFAEDGLRAVARIVEISESGRALTNETAIFTLALAAGDADPETRKAALAAASRVCRTGLDRFYFARDMDAFHKWGRGLGTALAAR